jgi:hypothetical protein
MLEKGEGSAASRRESMYRCRVFVLKKKKKEEKRKGKGEGVSEKGTFPFL